jgi:hypothetical protein
MGSVMPASRSIQAKVRDILLMPLLPSALAKQKPETKKR